MRQSKNRRKVLKALGLGAACIGFPGHAIHAVERVTAAPTRRQTLRPVLDGDWWLIGASPDLQGLLPPGDPPSSAPDTDSPEAMQFISQLRELGMSETWVTAMMATFEKYAANRNEPVDHHIFQDAEGAWHLWGCVRQTSVGRILYHWKADSLMQSPWLATGEILRCDRAAGESMNTFGGEEFIQSPYFVRENGLYHMFYGGHSTGFDADGNEVDDSQQRLPVSRAEGQICLMTSKDGQQWTRHRDAAGNSRLFAGPSGVRDPCLVKIGDTWHIYYAGYEDDYLRSGGCFARTSRDLIEWSDYKLVHRDATRGGPITWTHECPHVVYRGGYFYLFRTENYYDALTHVYRSENPMDFGIDDGGAKFVTTIACAAPEIYMVDGIEYLSSNHDPGLGTQMSVLKWIPA